MQTLVVVGGGIAGCAAAVSARKAGIPVILLERTDMLLGGANRAGRMNYNGKMVIAEECKALGGGELYEALEGITLHRGNIVDEVNTYIYNTAIAEATIRQLLVDWGVELRFSQRVTAVRQEQGSIRAVIPKGGEPVEGEVFIDATGGYGGMDNCRKYGQGCVMCVYYRCPTFGNRVSIATLAGAPELTRWRPNGLPGAQAGSIRLYKESLHPDLQDELKAQGVVVRPLPPALVDYRHLDNIGEIRTPRQMEHLNMVDIGICVMCVGLHPLPLDRLRQLPGLEKAMIEDPLGGTVGHCVGKLSMVPRDPTLKVLGFTNLFCAGEKAGPGTGVNEVICTGVLAGHNAARAATGRQLLSLPTSTLMGDFIQHTGEMMNSHAGLSTGYSMGHGVYLDRMRARGFYPAVPEEIHRRVADLGLTDILAAAEH